MIIKMVGCVAVLAATMAGATPAVSADLLYKYRAKNGEAFKQYSNTPYWRMLSECAGIYGSLVNRYSASGEAAAAEAAKLQGRTFVKAAAARLRADRGLPEREALRLLAEDVEAGRAAGVSLFQEPPSRGLTHEQVLDLFCSQVDEAHRSAARFTRR